MEHMDTGASSKRLKRLAWLGGGVAVALLVVGTTAGSALAATSLHQTTPIAWNATGFEDDECDTANVAPGQVLWHFVLVQTTADKAGSYVTATFSDGQQTAFAYKKSGGVLHFNFTTAQGVSLLGAFSNRDGRWLNLSHICLGEQSSSSSSSASSS